MYGNRRPLAILRYQLDVSGGFHFQVHRGDGNHPPLGKTCYKKRLGKTRVIIIIINISFIIIVIVVVVVVLVMIF